MRLTYWFCAFGVRWIIKILFGLKARGLEKIPKKGRVILAANHQSYLDPPLVGGTIRRELKYLAKEELFSIPVFRKIISHLGAIPIKRSKLDIESLKKSINLLESECALLLFPEGGRSLPNEFRQGFGGVGFLAHQTKADVFPIYLGNTRFSWKRLLLRKRITLTVGYPIRFDQIQEYHDKKRGDAYRAFSQKIMEKIAALKAAQ